MSSDRWSGTTTRASSLVDRSVSAISRFDGDGCGSGALAAETFVSGRESRKQQPHVDVSEFPIPQPVGGFSALYVSSTGANSFVTGAFGNFYRAL
jgi:hypothetical protein